MDGMQSAPWIVAPALHDSRLRALAEAVDRVRSEALLDHFPDKGDDEWVFGCKAYRRTCFAFLKLAQMPANANWLAVECDGLACTLKVEGIAIKFYKGPADAPSDRALRGLDAAVQAALAGQGSLFPSNDNSLEWGWLMAIETHPDNTVARVVLLQATASGDLRNEWTVPHDGASLSLAAVAGMAQDGGVELAPPVVGPKQTGVELAPPKVGPKPTGVRPKEDTQVTEERDGAEQDS